MIEELDRKCAQYCFRLFSTSAYYNTSSVISKLPPLELSIHQRALKVTHIKGWPPPCPSPIVFPQRLLSVKDYIVALDEQLLVK